MDSSVRYTNNENNIEQPTFPCQRSIRLTTSILFFLLSFGVLLVTVTCVSDLERELRSLSLTGRALRVLPIEGQFFMPP